MYILVGTNHEEKKTISIEIDSLKWARIECRKLSKTGDIGFVYNRSLPVNDLSVLIEILCLQVKGKLSIGGLIRVIDRIEEIDRFLL